MKTRADYDSKFWEILEKERLVDLSQFHKRNFCEEVPLYSRQAELSFLTDHTRAQANGLLLGFAVKFLRSVISYDEHPTPYFAAITVWDFAPADPIVPNLFIWSGPVQPLKAKLILESPETPFGRKMDRLLSRLRLREHFDVLEDTLTAPEMSRVFIAPVHSRYEGFVLVNTFRKETPSPGTHARILENRSQKKRVRGARNG